MDVQEKTLVDNSKNKPAILEKMQVKFESQQIEMIVNYCIIGNLEYYNDIRMKIFEHINESFVSPFIQSGLLSQYHQELLKTNFDEFL